MHHRVHFIMRDRRAWLAHHCFMRTHLKGIIWRYRPIRQYWAPLRPSDRCVEAPTAKQRRKPERSSFIINLLGWVVSQHSAVHTRKNNFSSTRSTADQDQAKCSGCRDPARLESWCPLLCCYSGMRCDDVVRHYGAVAPGPGTKQLVRRLGIMYNSQLCRPIPAYKHRCRAGEQGGGHYLDL